MPSYSIRSHRTQLVLTAVAASAATVLAITSYNALSRRRRRKQLNDEIQNSIAEKAASRLPSLPGEAEEEQKKLREKLWTLDSYGEDLIREQLARNYAIFGEQGMASLRKGSVVIVGCGGVGSWAAVMLVRSGISKIRLIDFDYVTLSSLNRHATATLADVGTPKVYCIQKSLSQISRWVEIDPVVELWRKEDGGKWLEGFDWVVDAIDNITTKVELLKYCHDHKLKVFSSMGAGAKFDPTRVQISDISSTIYDPLARSVRMHLRKLGVSYGIPVVYSTEQPSSKLLPLPEDEFAKGNVKELAAFDDFRVRILPVLGPLPAIFGLHIATYILCDLAGKPIANPLPIKNRRKLYEKMLKELQAREGIGKDGLMKRLPIDEDDISYLVEDLYRGRSLIPPHVIPAKPCIAKWDPTGPLTVGNCVVMDSDELRKHVEACAEGKDPAQFWGPAVAAIAQKRKEEVDGWTKAIM